MIDRSVTLSVNNGIDYRVITYSEHTSGNLTVRGFIGSALMITPLMVSTQGSLLPTTVQQTKMMR
jgi:hypothetical protein